MERVYDYQNCTILYVDDEEKSLKYFSRAFADKFRILSAANASDAYRLLEEHRDEIALMMIDQRMPGEKGVEFLQRSVVGRAAGAVLFLQEGRDARSRR